MLVPGILTHRNWRFWTSDLTKFVFLGRIVGHSLCKHSSKKSSLKEDFWEGFDFTKMGEFLRFENVIGGWDLFDPRFSLSRTVNRIGLGAWPPRDFCDMWKCPLRAIALSWLAKILLGIPAELVTEDDLRVLFVFLVVFALLNLYVRFCWWFIRF